MRDIAGARTVGVAFMAMIQSGVSSGTGASGYDSSSLACAVAGIALIASTIVASLPICANS